MKDIEIIESLKAGSVQAPVRHLYKSFPMVRKHIKANQGNTADAEDIFQEALLILVEKVSQQNFVLHSALSTYLFGVCRNLWLEELRRRKKTVSSSHIEIQSEYRQEELEHSNEMQEIQIAARAVSQLGAKCRDLLNLFYYKGLSMRDIAKRLAFKDEKVAKNQKYRCLEKAKTIYLSMK